MGFNITGRHHRSTVIRFFDVIVISLLIGLMTWGCQTRQDMEVPRVTLLAWHDWPEPQAAMLRDLLDDFTTIHPNVKIVVEYVSGKDFDAKFLNQARAGLAPDLILGPELYLLNDLIKADLLLNLLHFGLDGADLLPHTVEALMVEGKLYGVPFAAHTNILYYNKSKLKATDQTGAASPPKTLDALLAEAKAGRRVALPTDFYHAYWGIKAFGGSMLDEKGQFALDETFSAWLQWLVKAQEEPLMILNNDYDALFNTFADGEAAYFVGNSADLLTLNERLGKGVLGTAVLPRGPKASGALMDLEVLSISKQSVQTELCLEVVQFLINRVHQRKLAMGDFGQIPVSRSLRFDSRLLPVAATLSQQIRHTSIVPLVHARQQEDLFTVGDEIYLQVLGGELEPDIAPATALQRFGRLVSERR